MLDAQGSSGQTALMATASKGRTDIVGALLTSGAAVDARDEDGWTSLWAVLDVLGQVLRRQPASATPV